MLSKETQLQQGLTQLRTKLLVMGASAGIAVDEACSALQTGNVGRAIAVVDGDTAINALENEIDEMALSLLVRNQPVAHDLRLVVGALRMVIDLERIGDEAANIAERYVILQETLPATIMDAIAALMETAKNAYQTALAAFKDENTQAALAIIEHDDECVQKEVAALHCIMDYLCLENSATQGNSSQMGMHGILICRSLNRICRRSANIAEHVYFITKGVNIKHGPPPSGGSTNDTARPIAR
jgi:phosphate transport system regulatory protein PhoU